MDALVWRGDSLSSGKHMETHLSRHNTNAFSGSKPPWVPTLCLPEKRQTFVRNNITAIV